MESRVSEPPEGSIQRASSMGLRDETAEMPSGTVTRSPEGGKRT
jgi:hypothetical protein